MLDFKRIVEKERKKAFRRPGREFNMRERANEQKMIADEMI